MKSSDGFKWTSGEFSFRSNSKELGLCLTAAPLYAMPGPKIKECKSYGNGFKKVVTLPPFFERRKLL